MSAHAELFSSHRLFDLTTCPLATAPNGTVGEVLGLADYPGHSEDLLNTEFERKCETPQVPRDVPSRHWPAELVAHNILGFEKETKTVCWLA